jgi:glycosyltransferase involved in cell wall biosynthesis
VPHQADQIRSIAFISTSSGSLLNFRDQLMMALVARDIRVWALAPDYDEAGRAAIRAMGVEPIDFSMDRTGIRPGRDIRDTRALAALLRRLRPDATLGYFIKPVIYGTIAAWLAGVRHRFAMVEGMGYLFTDSGATVTPKLRVLRMVVGRLYTFAFSLAQRVFVLNSDDLAQITGAGWLPARKAVLIAGTGVPLDRFRQTPPPLKPFRFTLVGRVLREKGVAEFIEAARILRRERPDVEFELVGGTDLNPGAIPLDTVRGWHEEGVITWRGHVADMEAIYRNCTVFVLPSWREGKPRSTQEAMACGRAVVTTHAPGCRETVDEGVNGFKVPVRDVPALAAAMRRFLDDPQLAVRMGAASRRIAEEIFDVRVVNAAMMREIGIDPGS